MAVVDLKVARADVISASKHHNEVKLIVPLSGNAIMYECGHQLMLHYLCCKFLYNVCATSA